MNLESVDMPSGNDYGTALNWSRIDGDDFVVAFCIKEGKFTWVVEAKNGDLVFIDHRTPYIHPNGVLMFGLDQREWMEFKHFVLPIVDAYIEKQALLKANQRV